MIRQCWSRAVAAAVCLGVLCVVGCGPSSGAPKTVKAKVKAQFDDGTTLPADAMLNFHHQGGTEKYTVSASIPTDGEYTLRTIYENNSIEGAPPGKYKVTVVAGAGAMEVATKPSPECASESTTPLEVTVSDSGAVTPDPLKVPKAK